MFVSCKLPCHDIICHAKSHILKFRIYQLTYITVLNSWRSCVFGGEFPRTLLTCPEIFAAVETFLALLAGGHNSTHKHCVVILLTRIAVV